jgi:hypothetical protein
MKAIYEDLCKVLGDLEVICGSLDSLREKAEVISPPAAFPEIPKHNFSHPPMLRNGVPTRIQLIQEIGTRRNCPGRAI